MQCEADKLVLITGASGLLGRALVDRCLENRFVVLAHYNSNSGRGAPGLHWLYGDFSELNGVRQFLDVHRGMLESCGYLINNYGPMTFRATADLEGTDFLSAFSGNFLAAVEISLQLLRRSPLQSLVNIGYAEAGTIRAFKSIMAYALAKNALLDLTRSLAKAFPRIRCNMVSPATLKGARMAKRGETALDPEQVARKVVRVLLGRSSGRNFRIIRPPSAGRSAGA